jgi:hypothetical protein
MAAFCAAEQLVVGQREEVMMEREKEPVVHLWSTLSMWKKMPKRRPRLPVCRSSVAVLPLMATTPKKSENGV